MMSFITHTYTFALILLLVYIDIFLSNYIFLSIFVLPYPSKSKTDQPIFKTTCLPTKPKCVLVYSFMLASDAHEILQRKIS